MLLSQTGKYAVRAAIHLAHAGPEVPCPVAEIAASLDVPRNYLSKILHQLARAGVLESERGPGGGFRLAEAPEALSLADIVEPVEPGLVERKCLLGRPRCSDRYGCPLHDRWKGLAERIRAFLEETTLGDVLPD